MDWKEMLAVENHDPSYIWERFIEKNFFCLVCSLDCRDRKSVV